MRRKNTRSKEDERPGRQEARKTRGQEARKTRGQAGKQP